MLSAGLPTVDIPPLCKCARWIGECSYIHSQGDISPTEQSLEFHVSSTVLYGAYVPCGSLRLSASIAVRTIQKNISVMRKMEGKIHAFSIIKPAIVTHPIHPLVSRRDGPGFDAASCFVIDLHRSDWPSPAVEFRSLPIRSQSKYECDGEIAGSFEPLYHGLATVPHRRNSGFLEQKGRLVGVWTFHCFISEFHLFPICFVSFLLRVLSAPCCVMSYCKCVGCRGGNLYIT